ncbi:complement component C8 beta chain [Ambystoma mexicanum]|uniref:complement component C8 beta chain n=1 Tax=Ambystoma mexicanum TaxID=8296 RepID=UPI0037E8BE36
MRTVCLILGLTSAAFSSGSGLQLNSVNSSPAKKRWARSVWEPPQPIDCVLSTWSPWSNCDPCLKKRFRYMKVEQPSQFNGAPCAFNDKEEEECAPRSNCRAGKRCEGFVCAETGRCITRRLLCNGDDDCGDMSDEKNCKKVYKTCTSEMEQYWGIETLGSGLNIFTNDFEGLVLDHRYYAGGCSPNYIIDTRFRKPYNVDSYLPETKGKYEFAFDEYVSYSSYEESTFKAHSKQTSASFGFKIPGVFEIGFSYSDSKFKKVIERTRRFSSSASTFVHAKSRLEVARYTLKSRDLMLHYEFFQRVNSLPLEYSYGEYRELFRDYGTHYITEATLGGTYEYTLIINKKSMQNSGYSFSDVQSCLSVGFNIGANIEGVYVSAGMTTGGCKGLLKEIGDNTSEKKLVQDFVALVRGGGSEQITTLAYKQLPTPELMQEWGDAVQYNPDVIKLKAEPLYELVTGADFVSASTLKNNMKRALIEYELETSSCRCAACRNNGLPFLKETRCECICPMASSGKACEITQRRDIIENGNWGCWSSWSSCTGARQTRSRKCNNPAPQSGGQQCVGPDNETNAC